MYAVQDQMYPMHPLCGTRLVPYLLVSITRGAVVAHRYTYEPLRCRTSQYYWIFIPFSVTLCNDLGNPMFDGVGLVGFQSRAMPFY